MQTQQPQFNQLIRTLDGFIAEVVAAKLHETAALLNIARIDLIARVNGVSENELEAFFSALEGGKHVVGHAAPQELKRRRKVPNVAGHG